jgi:hypothetical protein
VARRVDGKPGNEALTLLNKSKKRLYRNLRWSCWATACSGWPPFATENNGSPKMSLNRVVFTLLLPSGIADFQLVAQETETDQKTVDEVKRGSAIFSFVAKAETG